MRFALPRAREGRERAGEGETTGWIDWFAGVSPAIHPRSAHDFRVSPQVRARSSRSSRRFLRSPSIRGVGGRRTRAVRCSARDQPEPTIGAHHVEPADQFFAARFAPLRRCRDVRRRLLELRCGRPCASDASKRAEGRPQTKADTSTHANTQPNTGAITRPRSNQAVRRREARATCALLAEFRRAGA